MLSIDFFYFNIPSFAICHLFFQGVEKRRGKMFSQRNEFYAFSLHSTPLRWYSYEEAWERVSSSIAEMMIEMAHMSTHVLHSDSA